ncbi:hypothetical protein D3C71_1750900 [compost metagenome]
MPCFIRDQGNQARRVEIRRRQVNRNIEVRIVAEEITEIVKHLFDDIIGNALNHPLFFRQRNKLCRAHHRAIKPRPAQQRFGTDAAVIFNINDRLIMNAQLALIERAVQ